MASIISALMEDGFDKLLYLVISILYAVFSYSKKRTRQEPPETHLPPSTTAPAWENDWDKALEVAAPAWKEVAAEAPTPIQQQPIQEAPVQPRSSTAHRQPKIERVLGRYKGWKKAAVMSELMRPYL